MGHLLRKREKEKREKREKEKREKEKRRKRGQEKRRIGEKKKRVKRETLGKVEWYLHDWWGLSPLTPCKWSPCATVIQTLAQ